MSEESNRTGPSRREINGLLDEHKGTAYVWGMLTEKYGSPKNRWGSFCKLVMRERKAASGAGAGMGIHGPANVSGNTQSKVSGDVAGSNSGSETGSTTEQSTSNIPMRMVRIPDVIVGPRDMLPASAGYPDAEDIVNFQQFANYMRRQQQQLNVQQQSPAPPPRNLTEELTESMLQTMQLAFKMWMCLVILRPLFSK